LDSAGFSAPPHPRRDPDVIPDTPQLDVIPDAPQLDVIPDAPQLDVIPDAAIAAMIGNLSDPARKAWPLLAIALLLGVLGLAFFAQQGLRDYRVFHGYEPAQCTVTGAGVLSSTMNAGQGRLRHPMTTFATQYTFEHDAGGKRITSIGSDNLDGVMGGVEGLRVGQVYPCWYDPAEPVQAVLARQFRPLFYAPAFIPLLFVVIAGSMLLRVLGPGPAITIADGGRGDALAVRLKPDLSRGGALTGVGIVFVLFTAALLGALAWGMQDASRLWDWGFFLLIAIAAEVGLVRFMMGAMKAMRIPDPIVEIDHEPVKRGDKVRVSVSQQGPARFDLFRLALVCERQGKGKGSQKILMSRKDVDIEGHAPLANVMDAAIDADAPPSDNTMQAIITWKIVVKRTRKGVLGLDRDYVFRVV
jgi:Protein of unknown function (DUF3592)